MHVMWYVLFWTVNGSLVCIIQFFNYVLDFFLFCAVLIFAHRILLGRGVCLVAVSDFHFGTTFTLRFACRTTSFSRRIFYFTFWPMHLMEQQIYFAVAKICLDYSSLLSKQSSYKELMEFCDRYSQKLVPTRIIWESSLLTQLWKIFIWRPILGAKRRVSFSTSKLIESYMYLKMAAT